MQKEAVYDAEGNLVESDESEQEATVISVGGITKGSIKKAKKKKGKTAGPPADAGKAVEKPAPESDLISADAAFDAFRDLSAVSVAPQTDAPVEVVLNKSRKGAPKKRKADSGEPFWKTTAFKVKKRAGSAMQSLSTRPETEVANAEHVSDVYSVRHGKGY